MNYLSDKQFFPLLAVSLLVMLVGCSKDAASANVSGRVTFNGQPLVKAVLLFSPVDGSRASTGVTNENGEYTLRFTPSNEGAVVGEHKVIISTTSELADGTITKEKLPAKYNRETGLKETLKSGKQEINFDLTP